MNASTTLQVIRPATVARPRGAEWFGTLAGWIVNAVQRRPDVQLERAQDAAAVRAMASRFQNTDPSFAADLFAAAARHEGLGDLRDPSGRR